MEAISSALAAMVRRQEELNRRLDRIESLLNMGQLAPSINVAPPPAERLTEAPAPVLPVEPAAGIPLQAEAPATAPAVTPAMGPPPLPAAAAPVRASKGLETSIGLTLLNRVGAVTLVIGIAFFFKWAVDNQYIGPAGRVELGVLAGLLSLGAADFVSRRGQRIFAQGITAVGICILYLSIYAAFAFYQLIPQPLAFLAMTVITATAGALALRYRAVAIAALGLFGGFLTPVALTSHEDHSWFFFSYLLLLDAGALLLARARRWRVLEVLSLAGTLFLFGGWLDEFHRERQQVVGTFGTLAIYGLYAALTTLQPIFVISQFCAALTLAYVNHKSPGAYFVQAVVLAAAGLFIADRRRWCFAVSASFVAFWTASSLFALSLRPQSAEALFLGFTAGYLLFLAWTPWWLIVRKQQARAQDLAVLALNGAAYFGASYWVLNPAYHAWLGLFAVALAAIHLGIGYVLWRQPAESRELQPILLSLGIAVTFLTLAAPIQFTAYRITMAWALEGAALTWIGTRLGSRAPERAAGVVFLFCALRLLMIDSAIYPDPTTYQTLLNARFLTFAITAVCLWLSARWLEGPRELRLAYYIGGHVLLLWAITQEVMGWAYRTAAHENRVSVETITISLLYALYAVALVSIGVATRTAVNRIAGLALIGIVVLKLYLFDIWQLARVYRTLAFVALGILLLSTSFLYSRFRGLIETWWKDEQPES